MISNLKRPLAALAACLGLSLPAAATTYSAIDYTDLWGTTSPLENGWGINLIQQNNVIFGTMFVYGPDGTARWYSASDLSSSNGGTTWTTTLAQTTGPYFGAAWTGNAQATAVGTITINFTGPNSGTLSYTVNGVPVTKNITRFSLRANDLTGHYLGGALAKCADGSGILIFDTLTVTQSATSILMNVVWNVTATVTGNCNFNGSYATQGRLAAVSGNFSCTYSNNASGNVGTFSVSNIESSQHGFSGAFSATDQFCSMNGHFGGVKDVF